MGRGAYQVLGTSIEIMHMESYGLSICELYFPTAFLLLLRKTAPCPILRTYIHNDTIAWWSHGGFRTGSPRHALGHHVTTSPPELS